MRQFIDENFLLDCRAAEILYHEYAASMPIIDYHNHLPADQISSNRKFDSITQAWLAGDHYKWRAMRANGIPEELITGSASDYVKFEKWAHTVPYTIRNPLYHWTHLELRNPFGINQVLGPETCRSIYDETSEKLKNTFPVRQLLTHFNVKTLCTTDDPVDSLQDHLQLQKENFEIKVLPTFRPDKAMAVENAIPYNLYLDLLSARSNIEISTWSSFCEAIKSRHDFFASAGCRLSDHGLETFYAEDYNEREIEKAFLKIRSGKQLDLVEVLKIKSACLLEFAKLNHQKGWAQQFHVGALRNNNSRLMKQVGADCGADSIGDFTLARGMSRFFDRLDSTNSLAKTIVYNLNPSDNEVVATMVGNFNDGSFPGKMQVGSAWWFLDQKDGMEAQLNTLSNMGLLSRFVGMLTDSRSFLSFPRHEYFRRILCNVIGKEIENGSIPNDISWLGKTVQNICYHNAKEYFGF